MKQFLHNLWLRLTTTAEERRKLAFVRGLIALAEDGNKPALDILRVIAHESEE